MTARLTGQSVDRVEGPRLLRGEGRFVGNIRHPELLHIAFVRSTGGPRRHSGCRHRGSQGALLAWSRYSPPNTSTAWWLPLP